MLKWALIFAVVALIAGALGFGGIAGAATMHHCHTPEIEQTLSLERGSRVHDDAPDADEGAIWMLQRNTRQVIYKPRFGKRPTSKNSW